MANATEFQAFPLAGTIARNWWAVLIRGVVAVLFGLAILAMPGVSLTLLVWFYGAYVLLDGVAALTVAIRGGLKSGWWFALGGIVSIIAAFVAFVWPGLTAVTLLMLIGVWSIIRGFTEIVAAIGLRKQIRNEWSLILAGAISVLFGFVLTAAPGAGALAVLWTLAVWALLFGMLLIVLAFRLRRAAH